MKKLKLNLIAIAALVIAAVTMSFEMGDATTLWHYTGTSTAEGQFRQITNWQQGGAGISCLPVGNKPCEINVEASDESELDTYLSGMSSKDVLAINPDSRRN